MAKVPAIHRLRAAIERRYRPCDGARKAETNYQSKKLDNSKEYGQYKQQQTDALSQFAEATEQTTVENRIQGGDLHPDLVLFAVIPVAYREQSSEGHLLIEATAFRREHSAFHAQL